MEDEIFLDDNGDNNNGDIIRLSYLDMGKYLGVVSLSPSDFELPTSIHNDDITNNDGTSGGRLSAWESSLEDDIEEEQRKKY